jgi:hypothetical protein
MKLLYSLSACAIAAVIPWTTSQAGTGAGTVANVTVRDSDGLTYVYLSNPPTGRPACAASTQYWMIPNENSEAGKKLYALLLAAQLSGRPVSITGKNTCVRWGDGEDINLVILQQ